MVGWFAQSDGPKKFLVWLLACILPMAIVGIMLAITVSNEWRKARQPVRESPQPEPSESQILSNNLHLQDSLQIPI